MRNYLALIALFLVTTTQAQIILPAYQAIQYRRNTLPTLITSNICSITPISANCSSIVSNDGGTPVTVRGICWSTTTGPTIDLVTKTTDGSGIGSFLSSITGLTLGVTYFVRAYATNNVGTAYGNELTFTTFQNVTIPSTVMCNQIWTTRNLDVDTYSDCTPIPQVTDQTIWENLTTGAWCYYDNDPNNNTTHGKLYNWYAVAGIYDAASLVDPSLRKKLAPEGWHVASDAEWSTLRNCIDYNSLGLGSFGGGVRNNSFAFYGTNFSSFEAAYFWTFDDCFWLFYNGIYNSSVHYCGIPQTRGHSVRCIKD